KSKAVLDIQRVGQSGLTMRTFEVLASGAILVTSNSAIINEPFFDPTRVFVISADPTPAQVEDLWRTIGGLPHPRDLPSGFFNYSLQAWVSRIVSSAGLGLP